MNKVNNNRDLFIDIDKIIEIFEKNFEDVTEKDWDLLQLFKQKIYISGSFAHKFFKKGNESLQ